MKRLGVVLDCDAAEDFDRARLLASKKAGKPLTRGELLKILSADYLLHEDPKVAEPRTRRMPPTAERPEAFPPR